MIGCGLNRKDFKILLSLYEKINDEQLNIALKQYDVCDIYMNK